MTALWAITGLMTGYLLHRTADWLPRLVGYQTPRQDSSSWPALAQVLIARSGGRPIPLGVMVNTASEVLTSIAFAVLWLSMGASPHGLWAAGGLAFFTLVALIDFKHHLVLNAVIYPAVMGVLLATLAIVPERLLAELIGGLLAFSIFFITSILRPGSLGGGDIKLAVLIGLVFGFPDLLTVLLLGAGLGALVAVGLLIRGRWQRHQVVPYAPFLCAGAIAYLLLSATPLRQF